MFPRRRLSLPRAALRQGLMAVATLLAGCSQGTDALPTHYEVQLAVASSSPEDCNAIVGIRFQPVQLIHLPPGKTDPSVAVTDRVQLHGTPAKDSADRWRCTQTYESVALAAGKWQVVGEFVDGSQSCLRDVAPGQPNAVKIDQVDGCSDPAAAPP
jgi:hypothetical protein